MAIKHNYPAKQRQPLKVALAGLSHDDVQGALDRLAAADVLVVGIAEENQELVECCGRLYQLPEALFYKTRATPWNVRNRMWCWPHNLKDLEILGQTGYLQAAEQNTLRARKEAGDACHI